RLTRPIQDTVFHPHPSTPLHLIVHCDGLLRWLLAPPTRRSADLAPATSAGEGGAAEDGADARVAALLERVGVPVEPRASWPSGLDRLLGAGAPKGRIPEGERAAEGRVIARMSDL